MTNLQKLEDLYNREVRVGDDEMKKYQGILKYLVDVVIEKMKKSSPEMAELYRETYWTGSFFDGLKVGSTSQEFDLNIVYKWAPKDCSIVKIVKNFGWLKVTKQKLSASERGIVFTDPATAENFISPQKMFDLLKSSIDRVLTGLGGTLQYQGQSYRVTRQEAAPVTLVCSGSGINFQVDFVPSFKYDVRSLPGEIYSRVENIANQYNGTAETFMAISLHNLDQESFQLDFHDLERKILFDRGCVKKVVKLLKYLRDIKGGPMQKIWSHLIKTSTMNLVMKKSLAFWNNGNLTVCFVESLSYLIEGLKRDVICDVFFPEVNLLDRIKDKQVVADVVNHLQNKIRRYEQSGDILVIFT